MSRSKASGITSAVYGSPKSKESYARFVAELAINPVVTPTPSAQPVAITVVELAAAYQDFAEEYYRKNGVTTLTADNIRRPCCLPAKLYGRTPAKDFGPSACWPSSGSLPRRNSPAATSTTW